MHKSWQRVGRILPAIKNNKLECSWKSCSPIGRLGGCELPGNSPLQQLGSDLLFFMAEQTVFKVKIKSFTGLTNELD